MAYNILLNEGETYRIGLTIAGLSGPPDRLEITWVNNAGQRLKKWTLGSGIEVISPGNYAYYLSNLETLHRYEGGKWQIEVVAEEVGVNKSFYGTYKIAEAANRTTDTTPVIPENFNRLQTIDLTNAQNPELEEWVGTFIGFNAAVAAINEAKDAAIAEVGDLVDDATAEKTAAVAARNQAEGFATSADSSKIAAGASETNAHASEVNAAASAVQSETSKVISVNKASEAAISAAAALQSEQNALGYKNDAVVAANNAAGVAGFLGKWNAQTNSPTLSTTPPAANKYYEVSVAGTQSVTGSSETFAVSDRLKSNDAGTAWVRIPFGVSDGSITQSKFEAALNAFFTLLRAVIEDTEDYVFAIPDWKGYPGLSFSKAGLLRTIDFIAGTINGVAFEANEEYAFSLTDQKGYPAFFVSLLGALFAKSVLTEEITILNSKFSIARDGDNLIFKNKDTGRVLLTITPLGLELEDLTIKVDSLDNNILTLIDSMGVTGPGIDKKGSQIAGASVSSLKGFRAEVNGICLYGQSLIGGGSSVPAINTTSFNNNVLMPVGGVRTFNGESSATNWANVVPLKNIGLETPAMGMAKQMVARMSAEGINLSSNRQLIFFCPNKPGSPISGLAYGTDPYKTFIEDIKAQISWANANGKEYNLACVAWGQGENDSLNLNYKTDLITLFANMNRDAKALTGQKNDVKFVIYQTASLNVYALGVPRTLCYQQLAAAEDVLAPNIYMAAPMYQFSYEPPVDMYTEFTPDWIHLPPNQSELWGASTGNTIFEVLYNNPYETHIRLLEASYQRNSIRLEYAIPNGNRLVLDPVTINDPGAYGYSLWKGSTPIGISSVSVVNGTGIKIVPASDLTGIGYTLRYGVNGTTGKSGPFQGQRGCVRTDAIVSYNSTNLYTWLPISETILN